MQLRDSPARHGLRRQVTVLTGALVAVALVAGVLVFATLLYRGLVGQLTSSVVSETGIIADAVAAHGPAAARSVGFAAAFDVQLLDPDGNVMLTTSGQTQPLSLLRPEAGLLVSQGVDAWWVPFDTDQPMLVAVAGVDYDDATYTVLVGTPLDRIHDTVSLTAGVLLAAVPALVALVAGLSWWVVVRALRPVEDIRARVEAVTATNLSERVPVPASGDEIAALATTMNGMLARLEEARDVQTRFVADASHELRSPITALSGALELMADDPAAQSGSLAALVPLAREETDRLQGLVSGLLRLARADAAGALLPVSDVDLDDLALAEVTRLRATSGLTIRAEVHPARVLGDADALAQVVRNLADNAVRHARQSVAIGVRFSGATAQLSVEDDGTGVPPEERTRVFERFVRLDESRSRDAGGSGLGLAIVAETVRAHGGTVSVDASPTLGGARFIVDLPAGGPS